MTSTALANKKATEQARKNEKAVYEDWKYRKDHYLVTDNDGNLYWESKDSEF